MTDADFENIVLKVRPRLMAAVRMFSGSGRLGMEDLEDAVQETLLRLWRMGDKLRDCRDIEGFAIRVLHNICIDMLRSSAANNIDIVQTTILSDAAADDSLSAESTKAELDRLILRLPSTQQRLLRLRGEGMTLDEISAVCAMPKASVKTLIARARRSLLEKMRGLKR